MVRKKILFAAGIYTIVFTPLVYEFNILYICISILGSIGLCWAKIYPEKCSAIVTNIINQYPLIAYYIMALGWVCCFASVFVACTVISTIFLGDIYVDNLLILLRYILKISIPISITVAIILKQIIKI